MTITLNFAASAAAFDKENSGPAAEILPLITFETTEINGEKRKIGTEGDKVAFVFKVTPILDKAVTFAVKIEDNGGKLGNWTYGEEENLQQGIGGIHQITMRAGEEYFKVQLQTADDSEPEPASAIGVRILPGAGYRVKKSGSFGTATIENDDKIRISLHPVYSAIRHGDDAWFKIQAMDRPFKKMPVKIEITGSRNVLRTARYLKKVNMPVGIKTMYFRVSTLSNGLAHFSGSVTATLLDQPADNYLYVAADELEEKSVVVRVGDRNSLPVISLQNVRVNGESAKHGIEGDRVTFLFRADPVPIFDTEFDVRVNESGSFIGPSSSGSTDFVGAGTHTLTFPAGRRQARLKLSTVDDSVKEPNGKLTASLISGSHYWVNPEHAQGSVAIQDNDTTMISLAAVSQNVAEGEKVGIEVTAVPAPTEKLNVRLSIAGTGGILDNSNKQVILRLKPGVKHRVFEFDTVDNGIAGEGGTITVSVEENLTNPDSYVLDEISGAKEVTIAVADSGVLPMLSLVGTGRDSDIANGLTEGEWINFTLRAHPVPAEAIRVSIRMGEEGAFLNFSSVNNYDFSETGLLNVTFDSMQEVQSYRIRTADDAMVEADGAVSLVLHPGDNYDINQSQNTLKVTVLDNDQLSISITSEMTYVNEGDEIPFRINTNIPMQEDITLRISIESTGNVLELESPIVSVTVPANSIETRYTLNTKDNGLSGDSGLVTASLLELKSSDSRYSFNYEFVGRSAAVMVLGNSDAPVIQFKESKVWDDVHKSVTEGRRIAFVLESNKILQQHLHVNLELTETGDFLIKSTVSKSVPKTSGEKSAHQVTFYANQSTAIFQMPTDDDALEEPAGVVTLKILPGEGYYVHNTLNSKSMTVQDNDQLNFTLAAVADMYEEGKEVEMRLLSNVPPSENITVTLRIDQVGGVLKEGIESRKVTHLANSTTTEFSLATVDNGLDGAGGSITVSILDDWRGAGASNESTAGERQSVKILLVDEEIHPVVSIRETRSLAGPTNKISEGELIYFILEAKPTLKQDLTVSFEVFEIGEFVDRSPHVLPNFIDLSKGNLQRLVVPAGQDSAKIVIPTLNDNNLEPTGSVTLVLHQAGNYAADRHRNIKTVIVADNDSVGETDALPQTAAVEEMQLAAPAKADPYDRGISLSVAELHMTSTEGDAIHFKVVASRYLDADLAVNVRIDEVTGNYFAANPSESFAMYAGEDAAMFAMLTVDNDLAEENGLVRISLSKGVGYTVDKAANTMEIVVLDNDSVNNHLSSNWSIDKKRVADALSMTGADFHSAMKSRLDSVGLRSKRNQFKLNGTGSLPDALVQFGDSVNSNEFTWFNLIDGVDFETTPLSLGNSNSALTIWGHGGFQYPSLIGNGNSHSLENQQLTVRAGLETTQKNNFRMGVAASAVETDLRYVEGSRSIQNAVIQKSRTTSVNPYMLWASPDRKSELGLGFGHGIGGLEIARHGFNPELAETTAANAALSGGRVLHSSINESGNEANKLSLNADAWSSQLRIKTNNSSIEAANFSAHHFRLNLEGSNQFENGFGNLLTSAGTMGIVWNSNDNHSLSGLKFAGRIEHENVSGISLSGAAATILNEHSPVQDYGIQWQMSYQANDYFVDIDTSIASKNGMSLLDNAYLAWENNNAGGLTNNNLPTVPGMMSEIGFGREIWGGQGNLTIFNGTAYSEGVIQNLRLGSRLSNGPDAGIELVGRRESESDGDHSHRVDVDGWVKW